MGVEGGIRTGKQETVARYKSWLALNVVYVWVLVYEEHVHRIKNWKLQEEYVCKIFYYRGLER